MKIVIAYYSRSGNTKEIANLLKEKLKEKKVNTDIIEIESEKRPGFFRAGRAGMKQIELPIKNSTFDFKDYDLAFCGMPTWAGCPAPLYKTFLKKSKNFKNLKVAVFMTCAGPIDKNSRAIDFFKNEIQNMGLKTLDESISFQMKKGKINDGEQEIDKFIEAITK